MVIFYAASTEKFKKQTNETNPEKQQKIPNQTAIELSHNGPSSHSNQAPGSRESWQLPGQLFHIPIQGVECKVRLTHREHQRPKSAICTLKITLVYTSFVCIRADLPLTAASKHFAFSLSVFQK